MNHKIIRTIRRVAVAALICAAVTSCGSSKKAVAGSGTQGIPATATAGTPQADMKAMIQSYAPAWQKVRMPINVSVTQPTQIGASGYLTMVRGESVSISMRVLGMEVASLYLTSDSITVVDRWNKRYVSEGLTRFLSGFPVTIDNVQSLFLGRVFLAGKSGMTEADASLFEYESDGSLWACKPRSADDRFSYAFVAMAQALVSLQVSAGKGGAQVEYGLPEMTPCGKVASSLSITSKAGSKNIAVSIINRPAKAQWDDEVKVTPFSLPKGYSRIMAADILKGLKLN